MNLQDVTVGVAICEADMDVKETEGNNRGPRIKEHLANVDPPIHIDAPWCAAALQAWSDIAAQALGVPNPLDGVRQEALVQSYHQWAQTPSLEDVFILGPDDEIKVGDLVLYQFGSSGRWNHIGMVVQPPNGGSRFESIEGNTPLQEAPENEQRDSRDRVDGVAIKTRRTDRSYGVEFIRWSA